jgi:long-chain acyl-CoA synthetase
MPTEEGLMNLGYECIERNAGRVPNRLAIIDGKTGGSMTYAQLDAKVNQMANALSSLGVQKGDRVALYLRNIPEFVVIFLANCKIGAISVPFNIMLRQLEIEYIINDSEAKILFGMPEETAANVLPILDRLSSLEKVVVVGEGISGEAAGRFVTYDELFSDASDQYTALDLDPDDPVSLLYTSGTTGRPKGALATHFNWYSQTWLSAYQIVPMTDEDLVLTGGPFFHVYLVIAVLPTLYVGATVVTLDRYFPKDALELITRYKVTHFMGTPTMWTYLIDEYKSKPDQYDISHLWQGQSAGAPLPGELGKRIQNTFGIGLVECYGATECSSTVTNTRFGHLSPGSPGWPPPGWEIKIMGDNGEELANGEVGELWCKGPGVIKEYWRDPEMNKAKFQDGWWKSGDLAYMEGGGHTDGLLYVVDRKDDMIVCGGYNIYPSEVESYLAENPKILQSVVIGVPDEAKGHIPKAFVVLEPGQQADEEEIISWSKSVMAAYKAPRKVVFTTIDDLPKTASGKILKRELRAMESSGS